MNAGERFDGDRLLNALTSALVLCLLPGLASPYLTLSLAGFAAVATANHLFPERLQRLTHVVKALYTHVVAASLGDAFLAPALAVSAVDLVPLAVPTRAGRIAEAAAASVRWAGIGWGFVVMGFPPLLCVVYGLCTAAYFVERRQRLARGARFEYGGVHALEHVAVWMWVYGVNGPRLDPTLVWSSLGAVLLALSIGLVAAGVAYNRRAWRDVRREVPRWFDPQLRAHLEAKARANALSLRFQHYIAKPFTPKMVNQSVGWRDIERMVDGLEIEGTFDVVVGVLSGGAFIATCVADRLGVKRVVYVRSRLWSQLPLWKNAFTSLRYYLGRPNPTAVAFLGDTPDLSGLRVLVVDDSVCTGATLASVERLCREHGATEVRTAALFCDPDHRTDFHATVSRTPLIWPWGWESD